MSAIRGTRRRCIVTAAKSSSYWELEAGRDEGSGALWMAPRVDVL